MATLETLYTAVERKLASLTLMAGVPLIREDVKNITTEISKALGAGGGLVVVMNSGDGKNPAPASALLSEELDVMIEVGEIPAINRMPSGRQIPAIELAQAIIKHLHNFQWTPGATLVYVRRELATDNKTGLVKHTPVFTTKITY